MSQLALPLNLPVHPPASLPLMAHPQPSAFDAAGFEIGWDFARFRLAPPAAHLLEGHPLRQGWDAGRATFGQRTRRPTRHVARWLDLRLQAWGAGGHFEPVRVTPHFLAQIEVARCPVRRVALQQPAGAAPGPDDALPMLLKQRAGIAAGNLVMVSRRVAEARGGRSAAELLALALRIERGELDAPGGLLPAEWRRLAVLLAFAEPAPHARLAWLPLAVLPPKRVPVLNAVQALQVLLTQAFTGTECGRRIADIGALMPNADARRAYSILMNTLLARRLAIGWQAGPEAVREGLEDAWVHPIVQRRWEQLALRLKRADCERIVRIAAARGLGGRTLRWVDDGQAVDGWATAAAPAVVIDSATVASAVVLPLRRPPTKPRSELEVVVDHDRRVV
jgi:hypothetical protein